MKRNSFIMAIALMFVITSCADGDKKIPEMATDFCNCFSPMEKSMSKDLKDILVNAGNSENPEADLTKAMLALDADKQAAIAEEVQVLNDIQDPSSELGKCMADIQKKYDDAKTRDEKKSAEKLLAELKGKTGCSLTYAIMKMGFKKKFE